MQNLWTPSELSEHGRRLNASLRLSHLDYLGPKMEVGMDTSVCFAMLIIANNTDDPRKRDALMDILHSAKPWNLKKLGVRRWSPITKAIPIYREIIRSANRPNLREFIDMQQYVKDEESSLSWATLMPDKMYLITTWHEGPKSPAPYDPFLFSRAIMPFGRAVQAAYSRYSGVSIKGQPTATNHVQLHNFEEVWSEAADCSVADINSGLHRYGELLCDSRTAFSG